MRSIFFIWSAKWYNDSLWGIGSLDGNGFSGLFVRKDSFVRNVLSDVRQFEIQNDTFISTAKNTYGTTGYFYYSNNGIAWDSTYIYGLYGQYHQTYFDGSDTMYCLRQDYPWQSYRSFDRGNTWSSYSANPRDPFRYHFVNRSTIYGNFGGVFLFSNNYGSNFISDTADTAPWTRTSHNTYVLSENDVFMHTDEGRIFKRQNIGLAIGPIEQNVNSFSIYPNPFEDEISIEFKGTKSGNLRVLDIQGKEILFINLTQQSQKVDLSSISSGLYFLVLDSNGEVFTSKVIKK